MHPLAFADATHDDVPALVDLVQSAYRGDRGQQGWTTEADLISGRRVDAAMLDAALRRPGIRVLVVRRGGEIVGCCELQRPGPDGAAHLGMFAVAPSSQGDGLGRRVLAEAERIVHDEWRVDRLELSVIDVREELIAWYGRRGYESTGRFEPFPYDDERFGVPNRPDLRFVVLAKQLTSAT